MKSRRLLGLFLVVLTLCLATYGNRVPVSSAAPSYVVGSSGIMANSLGYDQRALARSSDGTLNAVYVRTGSPGTQVVYAYSKDNGATWTVGRLFNSSYFQKPPAIAIDSKDNIHMVWSSPGVGDYPGSTNIVYWNKTSAGWQGGALTNEPLDQTGAAIAVDSKDVVHLVWAGSGWKATYNNTSNIIYMAMTASGWQSPVRLTDSNSPQMFPSIAVDSSDNLHLTWFGSGWGNVTSYENIGYVERTSAGWQAPIGLINASNSNQNFEERPSIAVDSKDVVHIVWIGKGWTTCGGPTSCYQTVEYISKASSGWGQVVSLTPSATADQSSPSIAVDSSDVVHVVWAGLGWGAYKNNTNIEYMTRTSSGWQAAVGLTDVAFDQASPTMAWAMQPRGVRQPNVPLSGFAMVYVARNATGPAVAYMPSPSLLWEVPTLTTLLISASPTTVTLTTPSASSMITVTAMDRLGGTMAGVSVTLTASSPGTLNVSSPTTGADGRASSMLSLSSSVSTSTTVNVQARSGGVSSDSIKVTFMPTTSSTFTTSTTASSTTTSSSAVTTSNTIAPQGGGDLTLAVIAVVAAAAIIGLGSYFVRIKRPRQAAGATT